MARPYRGKDFPADAVKGSVALLRSKFGDSNTTDTSQIFGTSSRGVSRSKTFHSSTNRSPLISKYNPAVNTAGSDSRPNKLSQKEIQNNETNSKLRASIITGKPEKPVESAVEVKSDFSSHPLNNNNCLSRPKEDIVQLPDRCKSNSHIYIPESPVGFDQQERKRAEVSFVIDTNHTHPNNKSTSNQELQKTAEPVKDKTVRVQTPANSLTCSEPSLLGMADPSLVEKYCQENDLEELNLKLKETRDFEERRVLRAAIRKLRGAPSSSSSQTQKQSPSTASSEDNSPQIDLSSYTSEEDLKVLLHQTTNYDDKKRIRAAIRELRKRSDGSTTVSDKPAANETTSARSVAKKPTSISNDSSRKQLPSNEELSPQKRETNEMFAAPSTPDGSALLKNMQLARADRESRGGADDVLVSPVKHESRILERPDGNIKIENYSKHSRTVSQSDVYEKSTKVTSTSKVGELSISEQDEIITKEKLSLKGSITTEAEVVRKVDVREQDGTQHIEEEISIEKSSVSKSSGEESQTSLQVSIVREKHPPKILNGLVDLKGVDSKPLTLKCEFKPSEESTEVTWLKDGIVIEEDEDLAMSWTNGVAEICIKELLYPDDIGQYTCRAKNKHGSVESSAQLTVTKAPQAKKLTFSEQLTDRTVSDGDADFTLTCKLSEKADNAEVTWYKNGKVLKDNSEFIQNFDGLIASLVISEIFPEDSGEYECCVVKGSQEVSSFSKVKVQETKQRPKAPIITKSEEKQDNKPMEDSNNNTSTKEETTAKATNGETSISKCEKILEAATIKDDTTNGEIKGKAADVKEEAAATASNKDSSKTPASSIKPVLKPVGMSRPTTVAEDTAQCLAGKLSKPGTAGNVSVSQSWKSNVGGNVKTSETSANKSWGKPSGMSALLGKSAAGGSRGAMAAFKQMDTANNPNTGSAPKPNYMRKGNTSNNGLQRSATEIKQILLDWCKSKTREYENVKIDNFSTSWNNGVAFLALIHHFYPDSFDWAKVDERRRRENFQLAFDLAEKKADIAPLLDVDDMVKMKKPDWKCVFTYVQSFYRKLRDHENNKHTYVQQ